MYYIQNPLICKLLITKNSAEASAELVHTPFISTFNFSLLLLLANGILLGELGGKLKKKYIRLVRKKEREQKGYHHSCSF
jgi:hypothetical protein